MTARDNNRCTKNDGHCRARHLWLALLALMSWLGCYSPLPVGEHDSCLYCEARCPDGLVCHQNRCVPPDEESKCDPSTVSLNLCVGRFEERQPVAGSNLTVVSSNLPDGLEFDRARGIISGTPLDERSGYVSVRSGEFGSPEVRIDVTATLRCVRIATARIEWCAGEDQSATLEATDDAEYDWQTPALPEGVRQEGNTLSGNVAEPGTHSIDFTLVEGNIVRGQGTIQLIVADCKQTPPDADGGAEGGAAVPLQIITTDLEPICAGPSYTSPPLEASGGDGEYQWSLEGAAGFSIDPSSGIISATSPTSGSVELNVQVRDGSNTEDGATIALEVLPAEHPACFGTPDDPQIVTTALSPACVGAPYESVPLIAVGGKGSYRWSITQGPDWLSVDPESNTLVGIPEAEETVEVIVSVEDASGGSAETTLTLLVRAASDQACGGTPVQVTTTELPDACIGEPYFQTLSATGGGGSYQWLLRSELPPGLTLGLDGTIRGTVSDDATPGEQEVVVHASGGVTYPVGARTLRLLVRACGTLVFIGEDAGTSRLLVTHPPYTDSLELSRGLLGPEESVISFRMSSATSKVAFLVSDTTMGATARLYIADASTLDIQALAWPLELGANPSVIDYVWSGDGSYVGVVARTAQQTALAVVSGETGEITSSPTLIGEYLGKLFSVEQQLCYLVSGALAGRQSDLFCNDVADTVLVPAAQREGLFLTSLIAQGQFFPGQQSFLAILRPPPPQVQGEYHDIQSGLIFPSIDHVFSPTLRWAAGLNFDGDQLELIVSEPDLESEDPIVLAPLPECEAVLAWSKDERTLVCQGSADVRVFKLSANGSVQRSFAIAGSGGHRIGEARRVISEDGRWFAYDGGRAIYVVDTNATVPTSIPLREPTQSSLYSGLQIDGAGGWLYYHERSELYAIALETRAVLPSSGSVLLSDPPSCTLNYLAAPDLWCGSDVTPATFFPSPGGDEVAFLSTSRQLHIANLRRLQEAPRQATQLPVKCTRPEGGTRCSDNIAWVRAR